MIRKLSFLLLIILIGCQPKNDLPIVKNIHSNWSFKSENSKKWYSATVPGNVFSDLLDNELTPNPFIKNNEKKVQWVSDSTWIYKTTFSLDNEILKKKNIVIEFEGLDTYSKIYINGNYQLDTDNAFTKHSISLKDIPHSKNNELKIIFYPTKLYEKSAKESLDYQLPEGNRVFTRKAQFQYGWDWGPKLNTSGIWKNVSIKAWDDFRIKDFYVKQKSLTKEKVSLELILDSFNDSNINQQLSYDIYVNNELKNSFTSKNANPFLIEIENPKLWWAHNLGDPYLYDIKVVVKRGNTILDSISKKTGIRTIKLINQKDSIGESFYFELNGKPIYAKGANYIPQNSFQNRVTPQHYKKLLSDVVNSNMNMLRVWGGGIYENDFFYNLCDEKGILVWQDFMFACAMYPGDDEFLANIEEEAEQQVKRLRNHASIALWCGNNENSEGWKRWGWQANRTEKEKQEIWNNYLTVFDSILPQTVAKYSQTDYWETSPKYGRGNPKYEFEGDAHDWWVWHDVAPFEHFEKRVPRFMSEFGFQSFPSFETINYINQQEKVDLKTDAIKSHQKHSRGFQLIDEYMKRDYKIPASDENYVYVSQLVQAKGIVMGIEAHRRAKPYNMGTLYWQLNDCWPAISWSSIDYFGNWKALHYKAKKAFENVLISSKIENDTVKTYIINDTFETLNGSLKLKVIDFYGKEIWSESKKIEVSKNSSQPHFEVSLNKFDRKRTFLIAEFNNQESYFYFDKPKNLKLPKSNIQHEVKSSKDGFIITLSSDVLEKDVFLFTKNKGHFSNNFLDILPNKALEIHFKSKAKEIDDLQIKLLNNINY